MPNSRKEATSTAEYQRARMLRIERSLAGIFTRRLLQDVADPAHGANQRMPSAVVNLPSQPVDHHVHDVGPAVELHVPDVLDDQHARQHPVLAAQEVLEKLEFLVGQLDLPATPGRLARQEIDA